MRKSQGEWHAHAKRQWRKQQRERLLEELREGEVRTGRVSSICSFGAFVDLGGLDGLVHISQMANRFVKDPSEIVKVQQEVVVTVLEMDLERNRISLSMKGPASKDAVNKKTKPSQIKNSRSIRSMKKESRKTKKGFIKPGPKKDKKENRPFNNPFADLLNKM